MKSKLNSLITAIVLFITLGLETGCHSVSLPSDSPMTPPTEEKIPSLPNTAESVKPAPSDENTHALTKDSTNQQKPVPEKNRQTLPESAGKFVPVVQFVPVNGFVDAIAYSHDGQLLAISYTDNVIRLFKVVDDHFYLLRILTGHQGTVTSVTFDPHGQYLTGRSDDNTTNSWEVKSGKLLPNVTESKTEIMVEEVHSNFDKRPPVVAFDPQGRYKANVVSGNDGITVLIELWEISSGKQLFSVYVYGKTCEESAITILHSLTI